MEERKFIKTFKCPSSAKKYGIKDLILTLNKNIEFPYYGLSFAEKRTFDVDCFEYVSYFKEDKKKTKFEDTLAYKLLTDNSIYTPCSSQSKGPDGELIEVYDLIYYNLNSGILKPTVLYTYNPENQNDAKVTLQYLFVFDNEWIFNYEEVVGVGPQEEFNYPFGPFDNIKDTLEDIEQFRNGNNVLLANSPACTIIEDTIQLEVCNLKGKYKTLEFQKKDWKKFVNSLCSVRIIEVKEKEKEYENLRG